MDNGNFHPSTSTAPPASAQEPGNGKKPSSQRRWRLSHWAIYGLLGLGAGTIAVIAFRPQPIPVDVGQVEWGALRVTIDAEGQTRVRDRYTIAAPVDGRLQRVEWQEGDRVEVGTVVAQIDPLPFTSQVQAAQAQLQELQAQLAGVETLRTKAAALSQARSRINAAQAAQRQAEAEVVRVEAALAQAQRDRQRAEDLAAQGAISQQDMESARLEATVRARELEMARRQVEAAIAEVNAAQEDLAILQAEQTDPDYLVDVYQSQIAAVQAELANLTDEAQRTALESPVTGQVLRVPQESARYVSAGTPILEIGNTNNLEIVIDVLSADAVRIEPGDRIQIEQWGGEAPLQATVRYIEPAAFTEVSALGVEEQRVNIIADFVDPTVPLGDGYRVEAQIVVWEDEEVLQVPVSALFRCQDNWCVFTEQEGQAQRQPVEIGPRSDFAAVVEEGLAAGDHVILHPSEQIEPNVRVTPR